MITKVTTQSNKTKQATSKKNKVKITIHITSYMTTGCQLKRQRREQKERKKKEVKFKEENRAAP